MTQILTACVDYPSHWDYFAYRQQFKLFMLRNKLKLQHVLIKLPQCKLYADTSLESFSTSSPET